jgi:hypothetical protein
MVERIAAHLFDLLAKRYRRQYADGERDRECGEVLER